MGTKLHKKRRYYKRSLTQDAYIFAPTGAVQPRRNHFWKRVFKSKIAKIQFDSFLDQTDGKEFTINELNSSTALPIQLEKVKC